MNSKNDLKQQATDLGVSFSPGRIDSIDFDESGCAHWYPVEESISTISGSGLSEARIRLNLPEGTSLNEIQSQLRDQLIMFKFSFEAWMDSYGEDNDPDEPLTWISDGTSFEDDFHRSAWILAGCGVLQKASLTCRGFDIPEDLA